MRPNRCQAKMSPFDYTLQSGRVHFVCTKLRILMLVKIITLVKNGGSLHVRHVCKYKWLGGGVEG